MDVHTGETSNIRMSTSTRKGKMFLFFLACAYFTQFPVLVLVLVLIHNQYISQGPQAWTRLDSLADINLFLSVMFCIIFCFNLPHRCFISCVWMNRQNASITICIPVAVATMSARYSLKNYIIHVQVATKYCSFMLFWKPKIIFEIAVIVLNIPVKHKLKNYPKLSECKMKRRFCQTKQTITLNI